MHKEKKPYRLISEGVITDEHRKMNLVEFLESIGVLTPDPSFTDNPTTE